MKLGKMISFAALIATAATAGATLLAGAANAAGIKSGDTLIFSTDNEVTSVADSLVDFTDGEIAVSDDSTGFFTNFHGTQAIFKDLPIEGAFPSGGINEFIKLSGGGQTLSFNLEELIYANFTDALDRDGFSNGMFTALLKGTFTPGGNPNDYEASTGSFILNASRARRTGSVLGLNRFDLSITALDAPRDTTNVPTPALLPALVGMGVAAFRKRKQELAGGTETEG